MNARIRIALCLLLLVAPAAVAAEVARYRVTLNVLPGDDLNALASQIAAMSRARLEPYAEQGFTGFVVVASDSAAQVIGSHPRVAAMEKLPATWGDERAEHAAMDHQARPAPGPREIHPNSTSATWTTGTYAYDAAGNVKSMTRADFTERFVYDAFGRIVSGTAGPGHSQQFTYDRFGNILTKTTDGSTATLGVDPATNRVSLSDPQYNGTGTYDGAGRLRSTSAGDSFTYDGLDTVTDSTVGGTRKIHLYSASDERIASATIVIGAIPSWDWTIRDPSGRVLRRFTRANGGSLVWREDYIYRGSQLLAADVDEPEKRRYFHPDHLGTPRLITGNGGAQLAIHTYFPFGIDATFPQDAERLKFTGHERDAGTLDYMHARYYMPAWGRFLSVDPYLDLKKATQSPQNWNRYSYVMNNPINRIDPDGRDDVGMGLDESEFGPNPYQDKTGLGKVIGGAMLASVAIPAAMAAAPSVAAATNAAGYFWVANRARILLGAMGFGNAVLGPGGAPSQVHHIATNKNIAGGFTKQFEAIFAKAGMKLGDAANKMGLPGHAGRHSPGYHKHVLDTLQKATHGLSGQAYKEALTGALNTLRKDLEANPDLVKMK